MAETTSWLKRWRFRLLFALAAVAIGLLGLELACRVVFDANGMHYGLEMWKYASLVKRRATIPELGHEHKPNASATLMGVPVTTNSNRLRDVEYSLEKPDNTFRVLVLGDSMTFGWGARVEDTYAEQVERRLNEKKPGGWGKYEVINAGVGNYNSVQEMIYLREYGLKFDPDVVVLGYFINDAEPTPISKGGWVNRYSYLYVLASSMRDTLSRRLGSAPDRVTYYTELYGIDVQAWTDCQDALAEIGKLCAEHKTPLIGLLIPDLHSPTKNYDYEEIHQRVADALQRAGATTVEGREFLPEVSNPKEYWVSPGDAHPNATAHQGLADAVYAKLEKVIPEATQTVKE